MWFKKPYRNVVGLSQEKLNELLENFDKLRDFGHDVAARVLRYVLDGEDEGVLSTLAAQNDAAHALGLVCSTDYGMGGHAPRDWAAFFAAVEPIDVGFYLRLGKVFAAAATQLPASRFFCQAYFDGALWLEILLQESTRTHARSWSSGSTATAISGRLIEEMLRADGRSASAFVTSPFRANDKTWEDTKVRDVILTVADMGPLFAAHAALIAPFFREGSGATRLIAVENLARAAAPVEPFVKELVQCAVDSSKLLRNAAESLLRQAPAAALPLLEQVAGDAKSARRDHAVRLLAGIGGDSVRTFLEDMLVTETNAGVKEAIDHALRELGTEATAAPALCEPPPSHVPIPLTPPVTSALRACLRALLDDYNALAATHNQRYAARTAAQPIYPNCELSHIDPDSGKFDTAIRLLEQGGSAPRADSSTWAEVASVLTNDKGAAKAFFEHPDLQLIHLVRFLCMTRLLDPRSKHLGGISWHASQLVDRYRRCHAPRITLTQLAEAVRAVGMPDDILVRHMLESYYPVFCWEAEAVWPFVLSKMPIVEEAFVPAAGDWQSRWRKRQEFDSALRLLATFPHVPATLVGRLWDMAVGTAKADRLRAQKVVIKLPDLSERICQALSARSGETRAVVAEWIGRLGDREFVGPLHAAAKSEKIDAALDEMLSALERLGEDVDAFLDRDKLLADAQKGLKKGTPPGLAWFPWAQLPTVHWQDSGAAVPAEIITWFVVQSYKFKSPEAGPLLRRYCAMLKAADRVELGQFVLRAWLDQDLKRKYNDTECRTLARQDAPAHWQQFQQALQWYQKQNQAPPAPYQQTLAQVEESLFQAYQREVGSASSEKGVLAVAGACCDATVVGPVQKYLKDWYGYRAAQCKALIGMLASIEHPSATQFLLSIANRFRTKGIREEAEKYVQQLAERKGWTLDELADRTLPTAGLEDDGTLGLSYGPRQFLLRVTPRLEAALSDAEGKTLKALPAPRKDDDEELAKAAKKTFSAAKAELKKFVSLQTTRLYEAMCTQRIWKVEEWRTYLMAHPLMKFLCQQLVWAVCDGERVQASFRPLDDGTFTDQEDNEVRLLPGSTLRIAHSCLVPAETAEAWVRHLTDYDVALLFTQFGRTPYAVPEEQRKETSIHDFCGHMVEAFKLRSLATRYGYTRGSTEDGGWFFEYVKSFPGMGLKVVLTFSGNGLPEENRTVALHDILFRPAAADAVPMMPTEDGMALEAVPAVLVSECYNDLRSIAATGTGYDAEWEKKVL